MFGNNTLEVCNNNIRKMMKEIETFILWHYQNGSKYDTPFWQYAKSLSFNPDERFDIMLNNPKEDDVYGQWTPWSFKIFKKHYHSQL